MSEREITLRISESSLRAAFRYLGIAAVLALPGLLFAAVPNTFVSGTPISAAEMNQNFSALDSRITTLEGAGSGGPDIRHTTGAASLSACANASLASNSTAHAGIVQFSGAATTCTIEFGSVYTAAGATGVSCTTRSNGTFNPLMPTVTTSQLVITAGGGFQAGDNIHYLCMGFGP